MIDILFSLFSGVNMVFAIYESWQGPAVENSYRLNVTYTIPVGSK